MSAYNKVMKSHGKSTTPSYNKKIEQLKFSLILGLIFVVSYFLFKTGENQTLPTFTRWYLAIFMLTFASVKLFDYKMFVMMFSVYDVVVKRFKPYAYAFPFILLALAGLYLFDVLPYFRNLATLIVALVAGIGVFQDVFLRKNKFSCGILGNIIRLPFTTVSFMEDTVLVGMSAVTLVLL